MFLLVDLKEILIIQNTNCSRDKLFILEAIVSKEKKIFDIVNLSK